MGNAVPAAWVDLPEAPRARTLATLELMAGLAREACRDAELVTLARQVALRGARPNDTAGQAAALLRFVQARCRYVMDPPDVEVLATPRQVLQSRAGDCDELATTLVALARCVGILGRFVSVTWHRQDPEWRHVYAELEIRPSVWASADPSVEWLPLGQVARLGLRPMRVTP